MMKNRKTNSFGWDCVFCGALLSECANHKHPWHGDRRVFRAESAETRIGNCAKCGTVLCTQKTLIQNAVEQQQSDQSPVLILISMLLAILDKLDTY